MVVRAVAALRSQERRRPRLVLAFMLAGLILSLGSCVRYVRTQPDMRVTGTCEGACHHYLACKSDGRPESRSQCLRECRDIFVTDGVADQESLAEFEALECEIAVAYVEGDGPAKGRAESRANRRSQTH